MTELISRDAYVDFLESVSDPALVRVITGVRRCGKSALLELYRERLISQGVKEDQILVINFEDFANDYLRDAKVFHEFVLEATQNRGIRYLHVDEVQELREWARVINSLRLPEDLEICVTGSNASMFAGESVTYLAGRYVEIPMFPLSLGEFQRFQSQSRGSLASVFYDWLRIGGFPASALAQTDALVRQFNRALFDSIFTRDIVMRGQIRDPEAFMRVAQFVFDNSGSPLSTNKIAGHLKAQGFTASSELVERYLTLMEDAHLIYRCRRYDTQGKQWLRTNGKFYFVDPGLRNALIGQREFNQGHDLENMVYLELLRRGYQVSTGSVPKGEIDFIAARDNERTYIQVCYVTDSPETLQRELAPFSYAPDGARCVLISLDRFPPQTGEVLWLDALDFLAGNDGF